MKLLLPKENLQKYNLRDIVREVYQLFNDYNAKKLMMKAYSEKTLSRTIHLERMKPHHSDPVFAATLKRERLKAEVEQFNKKLKNLKLTMTEEEKKVFKWCVEDRKTEYELCDLLHKSSKTVHLIKKSCYVKIALHFGLVDVD